VFLPKHFNKTPEEIAELQYKRSLELQWREDLQEARPDELKTMLKDIDFEAFGQSQPEYDENSNFDEYPFDIICHKLNCLVIWKILILFCESFIHGFQATRSHL
jgi:hypothetical protein